MTDSDRGETTGALQTKYTRLQDRLRALMPALVAFSGGVDSTLLLRCAREVLKDRVLALTVDTPYLPRRELAEARNLARRLGARHRILTIPLPTEIADNPERRCYICKTQVFAQIRDEAERLAIPHILDGTNADDLGAYRPGLKALTEMRVVSPLAEAGLTKAEIRELSRELGLATWDKPAYSCLLTRLPHGVQVTSTLLARIEAAETILRDAGFAAVRVRFHVHDRVARIEIPPADFEAFMTYQRDVGLAGQFHTLGFAFTALDLRGYVSGSMDPKGTDGQ
ncbi:MAG: ATP-dependent sacrificial sulfur transferase LarE [Desulfosarcinaceae bacterium]|nr:ATP-dependent sacrificial sulfur transferase LarE [Desulfosarcinaceae bacterium]